MIGGMSKEFFDAVAPSPGQTYADGLGVMVRDWMFTEKPSELLVTALVLDGMSWPTHITNQYDRNMMDIDHRPYLDEITCPVLVIHGRHDKKQHYDHPQLTTGYILVSPSGWHLHVRHWLHQCAVSQ